MKSVFWQEVQQKDAVAKRKEKLLNYMLLLGVTPTLPNTFLNFAVPDRASFGDTNIAGHTEAPRMVVAP